MKWIFGRSSRVPHHPLLEAHDRYGRRHTGADVEAFFRTLLGTPLYLPTNRFAERLDEADVMVLLLESEDVTALPAYLDVPTALVTLGQIGGSVAVQGSDACRVARERLCHELAVFADPQGDPELAFPWDVVDWLGAGLVPFYYRNAGDHAILLDPALEAACRAAVEPIAEITMAQLMEGVPADGDGRAMILATVSDSISPRRWFEVRGRIETGLMEAGHFVTVVTEPDQLIMETHMTEDEWLEQEWHRQASSLFIK